MASLKSVSILILQTPHLAASRSIFSGTPCAPGMAPPYWLHKSTNSLGTLEDPWIAGQQAGNFFQSWEIQLWSAFEFKRTVAGADGNG